jgi:hypothetical protein
MITVLGLSAKPLRGRQLEQANDGQPVVPTPLERALEGRKEKMKNAPRSSP